MEAVSGWCVYFVDSIWNHEAGKALGEGGSL